MELYKNALAIFYKEMIKMRYAALCIGLANILFVAWNTLLVRGLFIQEHSEVVWYRVMNLGQIPYESLWMLPIITAILFCCIQMLPEIRDGKIRIVLHAPCDSRLMLQFHLLFGMCFLIVLFMLDMGIMLYVLHYFFPLEAVQTASVTMLAWFLGGILCYIGCCFLLLEPQMKRRILIFFIFGGMILPLFLYSDAGFYRNILAYFFALIPVCFMATAVAADDYRNRWTS